MRKLKIYYTTDVHGFLYPHDGEECLLQCIGDFEPDENTLILDGGDSIQGSPLVKFLDFSDMLGETIGAIYDKGGYHCFTLGNHDFDAGFLVLKSYLEGMKATCLCANVLDATGLLPIMPYQIRIMENGLKVGITGAVTDFVNHWQSEEELEPLKVMDTFFSLKQVNGFLKDRCDVTICIYHGGFEENLETGEVICKSRENIGCKIARELDFDLLLTGHQHMPVEGQYYEGTYVVQPPSHGKGFAEILVTHIDYEDPVKKIEGGIRRASDAVSEELLDTVMPVFDKAEEWLSRWVCTLDEPLPLEEKIIMAVEGTTFADLLNYTQLTATGADISVASLPNREISLSRGVSVGDVMRVFPYPNRLVVLEVTGQVLLQALRRSASYFRWTGQRLKVDERFLQPKPQHHSYDYFANVSYCVNLNPRGENLVTNMRVGDKPLVLERVYRVAMSDFRASGMGGYEEYRDCPMVAIMEDDIQDMMLQFLRRGDRSQVPMYHDVMLKNEFGAVIEDAWDVCIHEQKKKP